LVAHVALHAPAVCVATQAVEITREIARAREGA
jgi:hypothetical protein